MPRKTRESHPFTPEQRKAIIAAEHLLGLDLNPTERNIAAQAIDLILRPVGLLIEKEVNHLFKPKAPVAAAKE